VASIGATGVSGDLRWRPLQVSRRRSCIPNAEELRDACSEHLINGGIHSYARPRHVSREMR
jgi:hypothetical protein